MKIKSEKAVVTQLRQKFSNEGLSNTLAQKTVTGTHRSEVAAESTDREKRDSTEEASAADLNLQGPRKDERRV